jgi:hypothetical protein
LKRRMKKSASTNKGITHLNGQRDVMFKCGNMVGGSAPEHRESRQSGQALFGRPCHSRQRKGRVMIKSCNQRSEGAAVLQLLLHNPVVPSRSATGLIVVDDS